MPRQVYAFEPPERFVAGTIGQPGERTFYLQAAGRGTVSVVLEKVQVALLAERLGDLLDEAERRLGADATDADPDTVDIEPLEIPLDEEFRVGTLGLAWDAADSTVIVEATAAGRDEGEEDVPEEDLDVLRVVSAPPRPVRSWPARQAGRGRPPAVPVLRAPARPRRPCVPAPEQVPALTEMLGVDEALVLLATGDAGDRGPAGRREQHHAAVRGHARRSSRAIVYKPVRGERPL